MKSNIQLKSDALEALGKDKWGISIGGFLIYIIITQAIGLIPFIGCLLYTSPSPRDAHESRMPSSA